VDNFIQNDSKWYPIKIKFGVSDRYNMPNKIILGQIFSFIKVAVVFVRKLHSPDDSTGVVNEVN